MNIIWIPHIVMWRIKRLQHHLSQTQGRRMDLQARRQEFHALHVIGMPTRAQTLFTFALKNPMHTCTLSIHSLTFLSTVYTQSSKAHMFVSCAPFKNTCSLQNTCVLKCSCNSVYMKSLSCIFLVLVRKKSLIIRGPN
jgi:hypothetical protein